MQHKRILAILLLFCLVFSMFAIPINANAKDINKLDIYISNEKEAEELISATVGKWKRDYSGYCGSYVHDILIELNIIESYSSSYNGKDWFPGYNDDWGSNYLCKGWTYECFEGEDSLKEVLEKYNGKVYNLVLSMNSGSEYGHVFFVNAIFDNKVYFTESYNSAAFSTAQKELIVADLEDFVDYYYNSNYYKMSKGGIIHFYEEDFYKPIIAFGNSKQVSSEKVYKYDIVYSANKSNALYEDLKNDMNEVQYDVKNQGKDTVIVDILKTVLNFFAVK